MAKHVHRVHAVDGRYMFYNGPPLGNFSNDNSVRLLENIPNCDVYYYTGMQFLKRQVYLDVATDCDFLMVVDTDEYIHPEYTDWDRFYRELKNITELYPTMDIFGMNIYFHENYEKAFNDVRLGDWGQFMRIIRNPSDKMYDLSHYTLVKKGDKKHNWLWGPHQVYVDGIRFATDSSMRSSEVLKERDKWAWDNMQEEHRLMMEATANGEML